MSSDSYDGKEWAVNLAMHYTRVAWIPIPSFDEILEAEQGGIATDEREW